MGETMMFPDDWAKFVEDYSFRDSKEVYTNGARLISVLRVEQMMQHYLAKVVRESNAVRSGRWEHGKTKHRKLYCSVCGCSRPYEKRGRSGFLVWTANYCPNCGADMRGE